MRLILFLSIIAALCFTLSSFNTSFYVLGKDITLTINPGATASNSQNPISPVNVTAPVGTTVIWLNKDSTYHKIVSGTPEKGPSNIFYGDYFATDKAYNVTFNTPGTYAYYDEVWPHIKGQIEIVPAVTNTSLPVNNTFASFSNENNTTSFDNSGLLNNLGNSSSISSSLTSSPSSSASVAPADNANASLIGGNSFGNNSSSNTLSAPLSNDQTLNSESQITSNLAAEQPLNQQASSDSNSDTTFSSLSSESQSSNAFPSDNANTSSLAGFSQSPQFEQPTQQQQQQLPQTSFESPSSSLDTSNKVQIATHETIDSFKASGTVNTVIVTSTSKWNAGGEWNLIVENGDVKNFTTNMSWHNGTSGHTHEFLNFDSKGDIKLPPDNIVTIVGKMDVGTNGQVSWKKVPSTIDIGGGGQTITISLDHEKTDHHFAGQSIVGTVTTLTPCSDKPGPSMEIYPPCA